MRSATLLLSVIFFAILNSGYGREFPAVHFTTQDGLPSNTVYDIYRDHAGFLWFATNKGIARYNGLAFEIFTTDDGLADNEIFAFVEDKRHRMWLATYNGDLCFFENGKFYTARNYPALRVDGKSSFVKCMIPEADSSITIFFADNLKFLNIKNDRMTTMRVSGERFVNKQIWFVEKISDNSYKVNVWGNVFLIDTMSRIRMLVSDEKGSTGLKYLFNQNQNYFLKDKRSLFIGTTKIGEVPHTIADDAVIRRIYASGNKLFLTSSRGAYLNGQLFLDKETVGAITQDADGNYWVGTLNDGVYKLPSKPENYVVRNSVYSGRVVYSRVIGREIFFATDNGNLYSLAGDSARIRFENPDLKDKNNARPIMSAQLLTDDYRYILFYKQKNWIVDDVRMPRSRAIYYKNDFLPDGLRSIYWIAGKACVQNRFRIYDVDYSKICAGGELHTIMTVVSDTEKINRIFCSGTDVRGDLWYSTTLGMYKNVNDRGVLQRQFSNLPLRYFGFFGDRLVGYTYDNHLVVCSDVEGNMRIDSIVSQGSIWSKFYQLDRSRVLIATNNEYRILTLSANKPSIVTVVNPFLPKDCETVCMRNNECCFFKNGVVVAVDTSALFSQQSKPRVFFKTLRAGGEEVLINSTVILSYRRSRNITFTYSALSFDEKDLSFQYSLSKEDTVWQDVNGDINLANAGSGDYIVALRARTKSGNYSAPIAFELRILPPVWTTWWFIAASVLLVVAAIAYVIKKRLAIILNRKEREHAMQMVHLKSEYKAMNALMNPHFIFNTLNNVQSLINDTDKKAANEYLRVFADLIRQNMHNVSKELISLDKEIALVENYLFLENFRFGSRLRYSIHIDEDIDPQDVQIPPLLIQPLVENSIKHGILQLKGQQGEVQVNIVERNEVILIEVRDNGVGLMSGRNAHVISHESFGLANIKKRIEQLSLIQNREISFQITDTTGSEPGSRWTVATISIQPHSILNRL